MAGAGGEVERGVTRVGPCVDVAALFDEVRYDLVAITGDGLVERSVTKDSSPIVESV